MTRLRRWIETFLGIGQVLEARGLDELPGCAGRVLADTVVIPEELGAELYVFFKGMVTRGAPEIGFYAIGSINDNMVLARRYCEMMNTLISALGQQVGGTELRRAVFRMVDDKERACEIIKQWEQQNRELITGS